MELCRKLRLLRSDNIIFKQQFLKQNKHQMLAILIVHSHVILTPTFTSSVLKMCHETCCHGNGYI